MHFMMTHVLQQPFSYSFIWDSNQLHILNVFSFSSDFSYYQHDFSFSQFLFDRWIFCHLPARITSCFRISGCFLYCFGCTACLLPWIHSVFYKHTGKLGWSSICLIFSQFKPEIMLDGMLNFKTHFMVWYCVWHEHCNGLF